MRRTGDSFKKVVIVRNNIVPRFDDDGILYRSRGFSIGWNKAGLIELASLYLIKMRIYDMILNQPELFMAQ